MRSLRTRLVLTFFSIAGIVVLAGAWGMTALLDHATWASLDAALIEEAESLVTIRAASSDDTLRRIVEHIGAEPALGPGKFIRVTTPDGTTIAESGPPYTGEKTQAEPAAAGEVSVTVSEDAGVRVVRYVADGLSVIIGLPVATHRASLAASRWTIWASAVAVVGLLGLLVLGITTRATNEILGIAAELETIEAGSLNRRLSARTTTEVDYLTTVLNRLLGRLEKAMAHLARFTANAAHELRTPVASLRAHLEVALAEPRVSDAAREDLVDALGQAERLGALTETLLALSTVESGTTDLSTAGEPLRLDELVRNDVAGAVDSIAQEQGRRVSWSTEPAPIIGAAALIRRLILNVLDNALRHTPPQSDVRVHVTSTASEVRLQVEDEGPGIPATDLPRVFDRFFRSATTSDGHGLGLALCREIAERHRARIEIERTPEGGTRVTVRFRRAGDAA